MHELARKSCAMTGAPESLIEVVDPPGRLTVVKRLSTDRLRGLGWAPTVELDDGMGEVLNWVRRFPKPVAQAA
jgi:nucleoside-diphosphate-sugar epimerase